MYDTDMLRRSVIVHMYMCACMHVRPIARVRAAPLIASVTTLCTRIGRGRLITGAGLKFFMHHACGRTTAAAVRHRPRSA